MKTTVNEAPWSGVRKFMLRREIGKNWSSNRVVDEWNGLSNHIVTAETIERRLDKFIDENERWNYVLLSINKFNRFRECHFWSKHLNKLML